MNLNETHDKNAVYDYTLTDYIPPTTFPPITFHQLHSHRLRSTKYILIDYALPITLYQRSHQFQPTTLCQLLVTYAILTDSTNILTISSFLILDGAIFYALFSIPPLTDPQLAIAHEQPVCHVPFTRLSRAIHVMSYYQDQNMLFYQLNYGNYAPQLGTMDSGFNAGFDVTGDIGGGELTPGLLAAFGTLGYAGEPPLLEELGINFGHIKDKTVAVLNPLKEVNPDIMTDLDLAGPILFVLLFGTLLLLSGKVQFGYVYGVGVFGVVSLHSLFKMMSTEVQIDLTHSTLIIGYCLLPLVLICGLGLGVSLDLTVGYVLSALAVVWCTYSASGLFVKALRMHNVRPLVAYPIGLFYTVFALMAIFVENKKA